VNKIVLANGVEAHLKNGITLILIMMVWVQAKGFMYVMV
jgi:hypothetical protein